MGTSTSITIDELPTILGRQGAPQARSDPMSILIAGTRNPNLSAVDRALREQGLEVLSLCDPTSIAEHLDELRDVDVICAAGIASIGEVILDAAPRLRALICPFIGIEGFDVAAATARGVLIANGQTRENVESMAEAAVMLTLVGAYDLPRALEAMRNDNWSGGSSGGRTRMLRAMTVGLIGYGQIGQATGRLLAAFGCKMLVYAPRLHAPLPAGAQRVELGALVQQSDAILLLAALSAQTHHLLNAELIAMMKPDVIVINVARGALIDEAALAAAAMHGRIGLALDVFEHEPLPADSPLRTVAGAVLTPHLIGHTRECLDSLPRLALENIRRVLRGEEPTSLVNPAALAAWRDRGFGVVEPR